MIFKKTLRYYYWLLVEFVKKNLRIILLSFFLSFILIISIISFSPYIQTIFLTRKDVIGLIGEFDLNNIPEEVTTKISNGLLFIDEKGQWTPAIASTWEALKAGKEYRFHIRDGLIWSDGKEFNTADITYQFKDVETNIIDSKTIHFKLQKPLPIFPTFLKKPIIRYPLVGIAGLYKVDKIKSRYGTIQEISLSPNKRDLPFILYKFYRSESDLINAYKRGEINQMTIIKKNVADIFKSWKNSTVTKAVDYTRLLTLFFNLKNQLLLQKEVRQATRMAINDNKFHEFGEVALGSIPPVSWAYNTNLKISLFDQVAAEKIFKKSNTSSGEAEMNFFTYYDYLNDAEEIINDLKRAGLNINLKIISSEKPEDFDLLLAFWNVPLDPDQYFFWHSTQSQGNLGNYKNVKVDKLLEDGRNTGNVEERKKYYLEFQRVITDDPPAIFLYFPYVYTIKRK